MQTKRFDIGLAIIYSRCIKSLILHSSVPITVWKNHKRVYSCKCAHTCMCTVREKVGGEGAFPLSQSH